MKAEKLVGKGHHGATDQNHFLLVVVVVVVIGI
jgi:hypothetical protein